MTNHWTWTIYPGSASDAIVVYVVYADADVLMLIFVLFLLL